MRWTLTQVADAVAGQPGHGVEPMAWVAGVSIDSRTLRAGELFVAIHGPNHDGHDHVADAMEKGALAAVVAGPLLSKYSGWLQDRCIAVPDTLAALHDLARAVRKEWGRKICGITGSVGKTTTKEILAALLGAKLRVLKSEGNFNNEYGLPLTIFRLDESHDAAVLEMGMSFPGELRRLAAIALPDVAVELRVTPAHLLNFSSVDEIALAKRELVEGLHGANSLAVFLNGDAISEPDPRGEKITDARFLLMFNAHSDPLTFTLPEASFATGWEVVVDTALGLTGSVHTPKSQIEVRDRAIVVLRSTE